MYKINISYNESDRYYTIQALNTKTNQEMGNLTFYVDRRNSQNIWLNNIEVKEEYRRLGIGTKLIEELENFAVDHRAYYIEGKYYPKTEGAKYFYAQHGYEIYKEDYETYVGKCIHKNQNKDDHCL